MAQSYRALIKVKLPVQYWNSQLQCAAITLKKDTLLLCTLGPARVPFGSRMKISVANWFARSHSLLFMLPSFQIPWTNTTHITGMDPKIPNTEINKNIFTYLASLLSVLPPTIGEVMPVHVPPAWLPPG